MATKRKIRILYDSVDTQLRENGMQAREGHGP